MAPTFTGRARGRSNIFRKIQSRLPQGVQTELGPDATGVGWVFQYALVDTTGRNNLAQLRSTQDWFLRYQLQAVPGVAEVAPLGGFVRQYQVNVDPNRLAGVRDTHRQSGGGGARRQQRRRRAVSGIHRPRSTWCAGAATRVR